MERLFTVVTILIFASLVFTGGLRTEAQCVDSVIVKNTWASIGSTGVAVPVYAYLCSSDTIIGFIFALQFDSSFLRATDIIYEVHDSAVPSFYDLWPNPAMHIPVIDPSYLTYGVVFDYSGSGIINPPEGRYRMFDLIFDVVAQDTGTTILDVTDATLGNKTPVLVDGFFNVTLSGVEEPFWSRTDPKLFALGQNYPNPFNSATVIPYHLPSPVVSGQLSADGGRPSAVTLRVYNILGQMVRTLVDGPREPGEHRVVWDGRDDRGKEVSSGIYLCLLRAENGRRRVLTNVRKLMLVK